MSTKPEALPIVAWRYRHLSEPGMIGHYPWAYSERAPRVFRPELDWEFLTDHAQATAQLSALQDEVEMLKADAALVRAQALEEAAAVCNNKANEWGFSGRPKYACEDAATTIRALKVGSDTLKGV